MALRTRRAWLAMRPKFNYGDHRDKVQREQERAAKRQLERDEAWARREKRKQERADKKKAKMEKKGFKALDDKSKAAKLKAAALSGTAKNKVPILKVPTPTTVKARAVPARAATSPPAPVRTSPQQHIPRVVPRSHTVPKPHTQPLAVRPMAGWSALQQQPARPTVQTTPVHHHAATRRPMVYQAVRSPTNPTRKPSGAPRVVRAATYPNPVQPVMRTQ